MSFGDPSWVKDATRTTITAQRRAIAERSSGSFSFPETPCWLTRPSPSPEVTHDLVLRSTCFRIWRIYIVYKLIGYIYVSNNTILYHTLSLKAYNTLTSEANQRGGGKPTTNNDLTWAWLGINIYGEGLSEVYLLISKWVLYNITISFK